MSFLYVHARRSIKGRIGVESWLYFVDVQSTIFEVKIQAIVAITEECIIATPGSENS